MLSSTALALVGSTADQRVINDRLLRATDHFHLITPATVCPPLPRGCEVAFTAVVIDPDTETHDVGGGRRSLTKTALLKLANAAEVSWGETHRIVEAGDAVHAHYAHWRATGLWRTLSTATVERTKDYTLDLRDKSDAVQCIFNDAKPRYDRDERTIIKEAAVVAQETLLRQRKKINELAQSGAQMRVLRDLFAIRTYWSSELDCNHRGKPFLVVQIKYVGSGDREDQARIANSFLYGRAALYGGAPPPALAPPAALPDDGVIDGVLEDESGDPLPVRGSESSAARRPMCDYCGSETRVVAFEGVSACAGEECREFARADVLRNRPRPASEPPPPPPVQREPVQGEGPRASFGKHKGMLLANIPDEDLRWMQGALDRDLVNPDKAKYRTRNRNQLDAVKAELARRPTMTPFGQIARGDQIPF